jgi:PleD family two-component response regulator
MSASLGVSAASGEKVEFLAMYRAADKALYRAKHGGRNLVMGAGTAEPVLVAA